MSFSIILSDDSALVSQNGGQKHLKPVHLFCIFTTYYSCPKLDSGRFEASVYIVFAKIMS